jgi:uncharacterized membrane protein YeaQ/YmgE (transglycosylase-associated protein family)
MGILIWIVVGLAVGAASISLIPKNQEGSLVVTIMPGITGAVIGGFIASILGVGHNSLWALETIAISTLGAITVLVIYGILTRNR